MLHLVGVGVEEKAHVRLLVVHGVERLSSSPAIEVAQVLVIEEAYTSCFERQPEKLCRVSRIVLNCVDEIGGPSTDLVGLQARGEALQVGAVEPRRVGDCWRRCRGEWRLPR